MTIGKKAREANKYTDSDTVIGLLQRKPDSTRTKQTKSYG